MENFESFGLSPALLKGVTELGFATPTPVQAKVIPLLLKPGRDVVALAQTGTGKTAAFGLPMLQLTDAAHAVVQGLILCPTRELCLQISRDLADFGRFAPQLRVLAVYGGAPISVQMRTLHRGVHILVATPGRLNDLLRRGGVKLDTVQRVVLDEADEMLNMGFQEELETILQQVPDAARTLLFSATMPKAVAAMAGRYLTDPEEIIVGQRNAGAERVTHECYTVHARDRYPALKRIVDARPGFYGIVFCRTRIETQDVAGRLGRDGYNAEALHGDLSQDQRDRVMDAFRRRQLHILVATDVASRGLDVDDLTHVINFDLPGDPEVYLHRSGRTGRAGKAGVSLVLINMREHYKIRIIERLLNKRFENRQVPGAAEVCAARLADLVEQVKQVDLSSGALTPYLPRLRELLAGQDPEEVIQRFVLRDFGRFLSYYKDAPDINVHAPPPRFAGHGPGPGGHGGHPGRPHAAGPRPDRPDRPDRPERGDQEGRPPRAPEGGNFVRLRVNLGRRNELTPADLISLINRATPGPMVRVGRIQILEQSSVIEVPGPAASQLVPRLGQAVFRDRPVRAVVERGEFRDGDGPRPFRRPGPGAPPRGPQR